MRNNQDRFLGNTPAGTQNPAGSESSVFSFVAPIDIVDLPSKGKYYPPTHPLHNVESVEIRHMTAKEEDILANKSYLDKGIALDKMLSSVLVDKRVDPRTLLMTDKNALLVRTRISGYGPDYSASVLCTKCYSRNEIDVDLETLLQIEDAQLNENCSLESDGLVRIKLPKTGWTVAVKPLSSVDQENLEKTLEGRKRHNLDQNILIESMKMFIYSINDVTDGGAIYEAINNMPARDSHYLRTTYPNCFPKSNSSAQLKCKDCNLESVVEVPFTVNFFWPNS
jgi:hypothetical protein